MLECIIPFYGIPHKDKSHLEWRVEPVPMKRCSVLPQVPLFLRTMLPFNYPMQMRVSSSTSRSQGELMLCTGKSIPSKSYFARPVNEVPNIANTKISACFVPAGRRRPFLRGGMIRSGASHLETPAAPGVATAIKAWLACTSMSL